MPEMPLLPDFENRKEWPLIKRRYLYYRFEQEDFPPPADVLVNPRPEAIWVGYVDEFLNADEKLDGRMVDFFDQGPVLKFLGFYGKKDFEFGWILTNGRWRLFDLKEYSFLFGIAVPNGENFNIKTNAGSLAIVFSVKRRSADNYVLKEIVTHKF